MIAVVAIYQHPELYPPTLNAVQCLSTYFSKIYLICNNVSRNNWIYPENIELIEIGTYLSIRDFEKQSIRFKVNRFLHYLANLKKISRKADLVLTYDSLTLLAYGLSFRYLLKSKPVWWYHNHDVAEVVKLRKGSIGWLSVKLEPFFFHWIDIFSLPSQERKVYFPMDRLHGQYFLLQNFPSKAFYYKIPFPSLPSVELKLIYQGTIDIGHGIETIISLLGPKMKYTVSLLLIGDISEYYKKELEDLAKEMNTDLWLHINPRVSYDILPFITIQHHVGLAIHEPKGIIYSTGGTASNKIYEYAACGLPVLYLNIPHYVEYLSKYLWAFKVDLEKKSILGVLDIIYNSYNSLSVEAKKDFIKYNNFESVFNSPMNEVTRIIGEKR